MTPSGSGGAVETERLRQALGAPELSRLINRLVQRMKLDRPLRGVITLDATTQAERRAIARLLGRPPGRGGSVSVSLEALEDVIRHAGLAPDLRAAVEALHGSVTGRAALRTAEAVQREAALAPAADSRHAAQQWYAGWLEEISADGTITRLIRRGDTALLRQAVAVLDYLPVTGLVPLPVLAERATGNTKALSGTSLAGLVLRALAHRESVRQPTTAAAERRLWEAVGVLIDDLASHVLVLNLRADGVGLATWLRDAADMGVPFRITLHQLVAMPFVPAAEEIFVCENPAVLRVAAAELGEECAPLICTEGQPSVACQRLVAAAAGGRIRVRWRGDFDWTGVRTTAAAIVQYAAVPWRMSAANYETALAAGDSEPLRGAAARSPWDEALAATMKSTGRAVMEERIIPAILDDLRL